MPWPVLWRFETEEKVKLSAVRLSSNLHFAAVLNCYYSSVSTNWAISVETLQHILWKLKCILLCCVINFRSFYDILKKKKKKKKRKQGKFEATWMVNMIFCVEHFQKDNLWLILSKCCWFISFIFSVLNIKLCFELNLSLMWVLGVSSDNCATHFILVITFKHTHSLLSI